MNYRILLISFILYFIFCDLRKDPIESYIEHVNKVKNQIFNIDNSIRRSALDDMFLHDIDGFEVHDEKRTRRMVKEHGLRRSKSLSFYEPYTRANTSLTYDILFYPKTLNLDLLNDIEVKCLKKSKIIQIETSDSYSKMILKKIKKEFRLHTSKCGFFPYTLVNSKMEYKENGNYVVRLNIFEIDLEDFFIEMNVGFDHYGGDKDLLNKEINNRRHVIDEEVTALSFEVNYDRSSDSAKEPIRYYGEGDDGFVGCRDCYFFFDSGLTFYMRTSVWKKAIGDSALQEFRAILHGDLKLSLEHLIKYKHKIKGSYDKSFSYDLPKIVFQLYTVPVYIQPSVGVKFGLSYDIVSVDLEIKHKFSYTMEAKFGYEYDSEKGDGEVVKSFGQNVDFGKPEVKCEGKAVIDAFLAPELILSFYGIAPIIFEPYFYFGLDLFVNYVELYADINTMHWGLDFNIRIEPIQIKEKTYTMKDRLPYEKKFEIVEKTEIQCDKHWCLSGQRILIDKDFKIKKKEIPKKRSLIHRVGSLKVPDVLSCIERNVTYDVSENSQNLKKVGFQTEDMEIKPLEVHYYELLDAGFDNIPSYSKSLKVCFYSNSGLLVGARDASISTSGWENYMIFKDVQTCKYIPNDDVEFYVKEDDGVEDAFYAFSLFYSVNATEDDLNKLSTSIFLKTNQFVEYIFNDIDYYEAFILTVQNIQNRASFVIDIEGFDNSGNLVYEKRSRAFISRKESEEFIISASPEAKYPISLGEYRYRITVHCVSISPDTAQFKFALTGFFRSEYNVLNSVLFQKKKRLWKIDEPSNEHNIHQYNIQAFYDNQIGDIKIYSGQYTTLIGNPIIYNQDSVHVAAFLSKDRLVNETNYFMVEFAENDVDKIKHFSVQADYNILSGKKKTFLLHSAKNFFYSTYNEGKYDIIFKTKNPDDSLMITLLYPNRSIHSYFFMEKGEKNFHKIELDSNELPRFTVQIESENFYSEEVEFTLYYCIKLKFGERNTLYLPDQEHVYFSIDNEYTLFKTDFEDNEINLYKRVINRMYDEYSLPSYYNFIKPLTDNENFAFRLKHNEYFALYAKYSDHIISIETDFFNKSEVKIDFEINSKKKDEKFNIYDIVENGLNITFELPKSAKEHSFSRLYMLNQNEKESYFTNLLDLIDCDSYYWKIMVNHVKRKFSLKNFDKISQLQRMNLFVQFDRYVELNLTSDYEYIKKVKIMFPSFKEMGLQKPVFPFEAELKVSTETDFPIELFFTNDDRYYISNNAQLDFSFQGDMFTISLYVCQGLFCVFLILVVIITIAVYKISEKQKEVKSKRGKSVSLITKI